MTEWRAEGADLRRADLASVEAKHSQFQGANLEAAWERLAVEAPEFPRYRQKTDREIPIIRLQQRQPQPERRLILSGGGSPARRGW